MALLRDLLEGVEGDATKIERIIKNNAKAEGIKLLLDDGDENCYVPKSRLDKKIKELKDLQESAGGEDVAKEISDLKKEKETLETKVADYENKIKTNTLHAHMKDLASEFKCQDATGLDLLNFVDKDKIVYKEDGTIDGIKSQIDELVKSKPYLFGANNQNGFNGTGSVNNGGTSLGDILGGTGVPGGGAGTGSYMNGNAKQEGLFGQQLFDMNNGNKENKVDADYYFK